jgi:hypothetical protein
MPYLNWKSHPIGHAIQHPNAGPDSNSDDSRARMKLDFSSEELGLLIGQLEEIYIRSGSELRVDLPENWIVFWKRRDSESRLLLAHPQQNEWVLTAALEEEHGRMLIEALRQLSGMGSVAVHELGAELYHPGAVSNVELQITRRE